MLSHYYESETTANDWICNVHFMAELEGWKVVRFENTTTVQEALQKLTKILNTFLSADSSWEDYVISLPKEQTGSVTRIEPLGPMDRSLKSYFQYGAVPTSQITINFVNKNIRKFPVFSSSRLFNSAEIPVNSSSTSSTQTTVSTTDFVDKKQVEELNALVESNIPPAAKDKIKEAINIIKYEKKLLESSFIEILRMSEDSENLKIQIFALEKQVSQLEEKNKNLHNEKEVLRWCFEQQTVIFPIPFPW